MLSVALPRAATGRLSGKRSSIAHELRHAFAHLSIYSSPLVLRSGISRMGIQRRSLSMSSLSSIVSPGSRRNSTSSGGDGSRPASPTASTRRWATLSVARAS